MFIQLNNNIFKPNFIIENEGKMILNATTASLLSAMIVFLISAALIDYFKKRRIDHYPFVSFVIPAYNAEKFIGVTISSLFNSYTRSNSEVIVINDCSKDNTLNVLKDLQKSYKFKIVNNKQNKGKAKSINDVFPMLKGEIMCIIDADIIVNKKALTEIVARFNTNPKVGGVAMSCRVKNYGILPSMQDLEYNMQALTLSSYNLISAVSLWGGCVAIKRKAFEEVGMLALNAVGEDTDLALKLNEKGWRVEQSLTSVYTYAPTSIKTWLEQRFRWTASYTQCFLKHWKTYLKNPITTVFLLFYTTLTVVLVVSLMKNQLFIPQIVEFLSAADSFAGVLSYLRESGDINVYQGVASAFFYSLFSLPYAVLGIRKTKHIYKALLIFPFALVYYPIWMLTSACGVVYGIHKFRKLRHGGRGW